MSQSNTSGGCVSRRILPFLLLLAVTACGPDQEQAGTTTSGPLEATTTSTTDSVATSIATTSTTQAPNAGLELSEAIAATGDNYRFVSTVTVANSTVTTIEGIIDGVSVRADISAEGTEVSYLRTPDGEWTREPDGEWSRLDNEESPVVQPLAALSDVEDVELAGSSDTGVVIEGKLGPGAGEAAGFPFSTTIADGIVTTISYEANTGSQIAMVTTELSDIGEAGSVESPEGS